MVMAASLPRASREQVLAAVAALEGAGPVTVGQIAQHVARELGTDMTQVDSLYDLRRLISWGGLQTEIKALVASCNLARRTQQDWARISRGLLFAPTPSATTWAYCTPAGALAVRELAQGGDGVLRQALAEQHAVRALVTLYPGQYARLVKEWLDSHPASGRGVR